MAGIDRIKESILSEANAKVETILEEAKLAAALVTGQATGDADKIREEAAEKAQRSAADYAGRIQSQIGMSRKQTLLLAKQDLIREVLEEAHQKLLAQNPDDYFAMILKLAAKNAQEGTGEILFGKKDLDRLPAGFEKKLAEAVAPKGAELKVSPRPADIESGFILRYQSGKDASSGSVYGSVEVNCSFESLIAEKKDQLSDLIAQNLF